MRRPSREIQIFNLSSLDLFASAMGSFLILTTILMPYYKRTQQLRLEEARLDETIAADDKASAAGRELKSLLDQLDAAERARKEEIGANEELKRARDIGDQYFRIGSMPITGKRIALLIDGPAATGPRGTRIVSAASSMLRTLRPEQELEIVTYSHPSDVPELRHWPSADRYEAMTPEGRARALGFVRALPSSSADGTPHLAALMHVLEKGAAENVILLSDGLGHPRYNEGLEPLELVERISAANAHHVRINTVLLVDGKPEIGPLTFFQALSARNGGQLQVVTR